MLRGLVFAVIGIFILIALLAVFPVIREGTAVLNATTNITQYEGMAEVADFAPLGILLVVGVLIVLGIFRIRVFGHRVGGDGD